MPGSLILYLKAIRIVMFQLSGFYYNVATGLKKPWPCNLQIAGFILGTLIKTQGFLIRFLHQPPQNPYSTLIVAFKGTLIEP